MHLDAGNFESHSDAQSTGSSVLGLDVGAVVIGWLFATPMAFKNLKLMFIIFIALKQYKFNEHNVS